MKYLLGLPIVLISLPIYAECNWTDPKLIPYEDKLVFQECKQAKKIKIEQLELDPNIEFDITHENWPESSTIWSVHSPYDNVVLVWIMNNNYQRNTWLINLDRFQVEFFTDRSEGRHYRVEFTGASRFFITHAGMGYRIDYLYEKTSSGWKNIGRKEHDIEL